MNIVSPFLYKIMFCYFDKKIVTYYFTLYDNVYCCLCILFFVVY